MLKGIDRDKQRPRGQEVQWACPEGHKDADEAPLPLRALCTKCCRANPPLGDDGYYEWSEVTPLGRERVEMEAYANYPAAAGAV